MNLRATFTMLMVCLCGAAAPTQAAPTCVLYDLSWSDAATWETSGGVIVSQGVLQSPGDSGSAALPHRLTIAPDMKATIDASVEGGAMSVQVEWFNRKAVFIHADSLTMTEGAATLPTPPDDARLFRLKVWLTGAGATAKLNTLRITAPLSWRTPGAQLLHTWAPDAAREADEALTCTPSDDSLHLQLTDAAAFAGVALTEQTPLPTDGIVMLDVQSITAGQTALQLICYNDAGVYLGVVDLLKGINKAKAYEIALSMYASKLPVGTSTVAVKVWLEGSGASARIGGIHLAQRGAQ